MAFNRLYAIDAFSRFRILALTLIDAFSRQKKGQRLYARKYLPIRVGGRFPIPFKSPFHAISRGVFGIGLG